ncbi:MAG TPA: diacylglycerol kinase family lipid kinase [Dehalococcoidia bacterium]|nr:diacylglycerol kinase family lipid kinase [Dehalococcoidia bacterium]
MTYAWLIVNPAAGAGKTARKWPHIMARLQSLDLRFDYALTEAPGHARELAKDAVAKGYELVVSVGGDGTINEVVNGLYDTGSLADVLLGIIGTGTGGDYIRTIGIPRAHLEACQCLKNPRKVAVDLGVIEYLSGGETVRRLFVNFAGVGFDAEIVRTTTSKYKTLNATASYLAGLLSSLLFYKNKAVTLLIDGEVSEEKVCAVLLSNGKYGGGGMFAAPEADISDGLLDVLVIGDLSKPDLLWSLPRVYRGTHLTHPKVTLKKAREIEIRSDDSVFLQADGELLGGLPARCYVLPSLLNVVL